MKRQFDGAEETDKEWRTVHEPDYKIPHVFNLHPRGIFETRPFVTQGIGARIIINADENIFVQGRCLKEQSGVHAETGRRYRFMTESVLIPLTQKLSMNQRSLQQISDAGLRDEVVAVYEKWFQNHVPRRKDGKLDHAELKKRLRMRLNQ